MNIALGMMIHNDAHWLRLHLPVFAPCFDGLVVVTEPRTAEEGSDEMHALTLSQASPIDLYQHTFDQNWSAMFNHVIDHAEVLGYDAIVRLDPDELIHGRDVLQIRELLFEYKILCFARYNFWRDRLHYSPGLYPDWQCRAFRLGLGIRLGGKRHEGVNWTQYNMYEGDASDPSPRDVLRVPTVNIYHYGWIGRERMLDRDFHYLNVAREREGLPPLFERPADRPFPERHNIFFYGEQPLDPYSVGIHAPFKE